MAIRGRLRHLRRVLRIKTGSAVIFWGVLCWLLLGSGHLPLGAEPATTVVPPQDTASTPAPRTWPLLQPGDTGEAVQQLQAELQRIGVLPSPMDGQYGPVTEAAVREFQRTQGLTPDGIVGTETWQALALAQGPIRMVDWQAFIPNSPLTFTPLTFSQPSPPPSAFWLVLMPLVPLAGGALTYLVRRLVGRKPIPPLSSRPSNLHSRHDRHPRR
jgi:hypothetical protein